MKILLDENLPIKLKSHFDNQHEVYTTFEMSWNGKQNGELLNLLNDYHYNVLITADKNLKYQQRLPKYQFSIFILNAPNNRLATLIPYIKKVNALLKAEVKMGFNEIEI